MVGTAFLGFIFGKRFFLGEELFYYMRTICFPQSKKTTRSKLNHKTLFNIKSNLLREILTPNNQNTQVSIFDVMNHLMNHVEENHLLDDSSLVISLDQHLKNLLETSLETINLHDLNDYIYNTLLVTNISKK